MDDTQKILNLLQHEDRKNRLLAFELMDGLGLHQEINSLINDASNFRFLTGEPSSSLFNYEGCFDKTAVRKVLRSLRALMRSFQFSERMVKKAAGLTAYITEDFFQAYKATNKGQILFEATDQIFWMGFNWKIQAIYHQSLAEQLHLIHQTRKNIPVKSFINLMQGLSTPEKGTQLIWRNLEQQLRNQEFCHYFEFLPQQQCRFYFLVALKELPKPKKK